MTIYVLISDFQTQKGGEAGKHCRKYVNLTVKQNGGYAHHLQAAGLRSHYPQTEQMNEGSF